jgi:hypothetical protein
VLVCNDGLATLNTLKIQSDPYGNIGGAAYMVIIQTNKIINILLPYMQSRSMEMR